MFLFEEISIKCVYTYKFLIPLFLLQRWNTISNPVLYYCYLPIYPGIHSQGVIRNHPHSFYYYVILSTVQMLICRTLTEKRGKGMLDSADGTEQAGK